MRSGIALCLSGGGFRSALFHLGAIRRLKELHLLHEVALISSVSGGSLVAGFLADRLVRAGVGSKEAFLRWLDGVDWEAEVAAPFRRVTSRDLRTWPVVKNVLWNWIAPGLRVRDLERRYRRRISRLRLAELPEYPSFALNATNLAFGVNWEFNREGAGDYQGGHLSRARDWPLARAMAASSSFPPVFGPLSIRADPRDFAGGSYRGSDRERLLAKTSLTDGGVYDNLGLEPAWKNYATVLVSDCGAPFEFSVHKSPLRALLRYTSVIMNQAGSLRKRMFFYQRSKGEYTGTYWGIRSAAGKKTERELASLPESDEIGIAEGGELPGYSRELVDGWIAEVRTDLDAFTEAEQKILENHGYFAANHSLTRYLTEPRPRQAPVSPPHPEWLGELEVQKALASSRARVSLARTWRVLVDRVSRKA